MIDFGTAMIEIAAGKMAWRDTSDPMPTAKNQENVFPSSQSWPRLPKSCVPIFGI